MDLLTGKGDAICILSMSQGPRGSAKCFDTVLLSWTQSHRLRCSLFLFDMTKPFQWMFMSGTLLDPDQQLVYQMQKVGRTIHRPVGPHLDHVEECLLLMAFLIQGCYGLF